MPSSVACNPGCMSILVAPYWNLNHIDNNRALPLIKILVAPYWNLNINVTVDNTKVENDISSSILEFKFHKIKFF